MKRISSAILLLIVSIAVPAWGASSWWVQVNHQGYLTENGEPVNSIGLRMDFRLFASETPTDGEVALWDEFHQVEVVNGIHSLRLGRWAPFPVDLFSNNWRVWLEVEVGQSGNPLPRQLLTDVPYAAYAYDADRVDGLEASSFSLLSHNHEAQYSSSLHDHDSRYSLLEHSYPNMSGLEAHL